MRPTYVAHHNIHKDAKKGFGVPTLALGFLDRTRRAAILSNMKRGEPRSLLDRITKLAEKRQKAIATKCHPAIFEIAPLLKECAQGLKQLGPAPPPELVVQVQTRFNKGFQEIRERYARNGYPFGCPDCGLTVAPAILGDASPGNTSGRHWLEDTIHWLRYKVPLRVDLWRREKAEWEPTRRTLETEQKFEQIRCGVSVSPEKFKGSEEHLLLFVVLWGLGIEELTAEELADFFDLYCPCGSEEHDPDALKKQRRRFRKALENSPTWSPLPHIHTPRADTLDENQSKKK